MSIRAIFCILLVYVAMWSVFWLFWLSCHYLPSDWLERLLWWSLIVARGSSPQSPGRRVFMNSWFSVLCHCFMMRLSCPLAVCDMFHTSMALYSLFVLNMTLNTKYLTNCVARWPSGEDAGLAISRTRVRILAFPLSSATLGKLLTHMPLSPSSIIWYQPMGGTRHQPCSWEGNCRSGIVLAMSHRQ